MHHFDCGLTESYLTCINPYYQAIQIIPRTTLFCHSKKQVINCKFHGHWFWNLKSGLYVKYKISGFPEAGVFQQKQHNSITILVISLYSVTIISFLTQLMDLSSYFYCSYGMLNFCLEFHQALQQVSYQSLAVYHTHLYQRTLKYFRGYTQHIWNKELNMRYTGSVSQYTLMEKYALSSKNLLFTIIIIITISI